MIIITTMWFNLDILEKEDGLIPAIDEIYIYISLILIDFMFEHLCWYPLGIPKQIN
jgi:hypothetical protein